ncbi:MAG: dephospho-CoA kinase [Rubrobacteraceae bacterium]
MTIAVTGPFASGKSTFVRMLGDLGAETVSSDEIVHDLLATDEEAIATVVDRFGEQVRGERGIDRRLLAREVFGDAEALRDLEDILHPLVRRETGRRIEDSGAELFVAEIPLLFEGKRSGAFDHTVAVTVPEERRREWAEERGVGEEQLRAIEERQLPGEEKAGRADFVVENDGGLDRLEEQARYLQDRALGGRSPNGDVRTQET